MPTLNPDLAAPFVAGRVANEAGDIWATPRSLIQFGIILIPQELGDEAIAKGWRRHREQGFRGYVRLERAAPKSPSGNNP